MILLFRLKCQALNSKIGNTNKVAVIKTLKWTRGVTGLDGIRNEYV